MSHSVISPAILYWGTPVVLITTTNPGGTPNICPMSSAFWLGNRCMLGLDASSQTTANLRLTKQCVLNLPSSDDLIPAINALARTTGTPTPDISPHKQAWGYRYVKDKFKAARLTELKSEVVGCPRIKECKVQMEAEMVGEYEMMGSLPGEAKGFTVAIEVKVVRTYVTDDLRLAGFANRVDPDKWRPTIMIFQELKGVERERAGESMLAGIEEELYRLPDEE